MWRVQTHYHTAQAKRLGAPPCALHAARDFPGPAIALGEKAGKVLQNLSVLETFGALKGFQDCGSGVIVDLGRTWSNQVVSWVLSVWPSHYGFDSI